MVNLREVAPGLFVGAEAATREMNWALVVSVGGDDQRPSAPQIRWYFDDGVPIPDGLLDLVHARVTGQGQAPVLIHCAAGRSRSASVAYALIRANGGLDHAGALARVQTPGDEGRYPMPATLQSARRWVASKR